MGKVPILPGTHFPAHPRDGGGGQTTDRHDTENRDTEFYIKVVRFGDCQERGGAGERRGHPDRDEDENKKPTGDTQAHCCRG